MSLTPGVRVGAYEVISALGAGSMGEVYLARDDRLNRNVAIKFLSPTLVNDPELVRRFETEARAIAALSHPHIVDVYDVGHHDGAPYIVMQYVEGGTLSAYLKEQRPSLGRALEIGMEIADALAAAHRAGLIHRDLKPGNVMLTADRRVKVVDFGLAKRVLLSDAMTTSGVHGLEDLQTIPGQVMGTPGYMSPEQLAGLPVDVRTDIYSLGVILFQLFTGQRPFQDPASNPFSETVPSVCAVDPQLPEAIGELITRTMSRDPAARPDSADAVRRELARLHRAFESPSVLPTPSTNNRRRRAIRPMGRYIAAAVAALLIVAGAAIPIVWRTVFPRMSTPQGRPVIAVIPMTNLSADESQAYLGAGITDALTTSLGRLPSISVVSHTEMQESRALRSSNLAKIAEDLGATMFVQGSVQQSGNRVHVSANLLTADGKIIWSGDSEAALADLFSLESRLAGSLADALRLNLSEAERRRLTTPPTSRRDALEAYWRGTAFRDRSDNDTAVDRAIAEFQKATSLDKDFSLAHASLGEAYRRKSVVTNDKQWMAKAAEEVTEALRLDPSQPEIRLALANVYRSTGRNGAAVEELSRIVSEQPENDNARRMLGQILADEGRFDDALSQVQRAIQLRPQYWANHDALGYISLRAGKLPDAVVAYTKVTELKPDDNSGYQQLGTAYQLAGDYAHARVNYERAISLGPNANAYSNLGFIYYAERRYEDAVRAFNDAIRLAPKRHVYHRNLGDAYLKLGRKAEAIAAYKEAIRLAEETLAVNPTDSLTLVRLAIYEAKIGLRQDAERHAESAITLNPTSPEVLYRRAVVFALNGAPDKALKDLTEAISKGFSKQQVLDDDDLASLRSLPEFQSLIQSPK
jgi:serine/threonine-protein kinase